MGVSMINNTNTKLLISDSEANELLDRRIEKGKKLVDKNISSPDELEKAKEKYEKWDSYNSELLKEIFNNKSMVEEYEGLEIFIGKWGGAPLSEDCKNYKERIRKKINKLKTVKEKIELYNDINNKINETELKEEEKVGENEQIEKIFISHSSLDEEYAKAFVRLLTDMKVPEDKIFCSSVKGYGIELGEDFLEYIRKTLDDNVLVLFLLSESFYHSKISLCEMGATWVKTNIHIPVIIPPFTFEDIEGVIIGKQGLEINNKGDINELKIKISKLLNLESLNPNIWESRRDEFLDKVNNIIEEDNNHEKIPKQEPGLTSGERNNENIHFHIFSSADSDGMEPKSHRPAAQRRTGLGHGGSDGKGSFGHQCGRAAASGLRQGQKPYPAAAGPGF